MTKIKKIIAAVLILTVMNIFPWGQKAVAGSTGIKIDGNTEGRTFEGLGSLSAGASSRLLIDYPEPYRSQILDYLFKPNFGASLQHLKVEMGGDVNSTDGTEPAHARSRQELDSPKAVYYNRGYEWFLMEEAKKRNPEIMLDALQWGAPGWVRPDDGSAAGSQNYDLKRFYSKDNADFIAAFVKGAKQYHNLDINYVGIWNERYNSKYNNWIITLRNTLDKNSLTGTKIVAADSNVNVWQSALELTMNKSLRDAIYAVGVHYPGWGQTGPGDGANKNNSSAQAVGKPLWSSEDGPWRGDWIGAQQLARLFNKNYIENKITKTITWSVITSYLDTLPIPGSGMMKANQPWSGNYLVQPALWSFAHTTQFTRPGWKYIDSGCGYLPGGGSYVTLKEPGAGKNFSLIVETMGAKDTQKIDFTFTNLANKELHIWKSNRTEQFVYAGKVTPVNGKITLDFEKSSIYSITTTTGQKKGSYGDPPGRSAFQKSIVYDFEKYDPGKQAKYFSDQAGSFEIYKEGSGNKVLRQVVDNKGVYWYGDYEPFTLLANEGFDDYEVRSRVKIEKTGSVSIYGRALGTAYGQFHPNGYGFTLKDDGSWEISTGSNNKKNVIKGGKVSAKSGEWHYMSMTFAGKSIKASIDDKVVAELENTLYKRGMAGLGSGRNYAMFDDFSVKSIEDGIIIPTPSPTAVPATPNPTGTTSQGPSQSTSGATTGQPSQTGDGTPSQALTPDPSASPDPGSSTTGPQQTEDKPAAGNRNKTSGNTTILQIIILLLVIIVIAEEAYIIIRRRQKK